MKKIAESATVAVNATAKAKKLAGKKVYNFAAGDPILPTHPSIIKRVIAQAQTRSFPYPPLEGVKELRQLAASWMNNRCATEYNKEQVLVTCGGKFALFSLLYMLLTPGEEVFISSPYWVSYPELVTMAGGKVKCLATSAEDGWKITAQDLLQHASEKSKILILNNPSNPTGSLYTKEELATILEAAKELNLFVISDEVYSSLVYEGGFVSCGAFSEHADRVAVVQSCSKNFAMTGWRVGFVMGNEQLIRSLIPFQGQTTTGVPLISQWAAVGALEDADAVEAYVVSAMKKRRDTFVATYNELFPIALPTPPAAIYAFVSLAQLGVTSDSKSFCKKLIDTYNIALVPGIAFGVEGYARFAFSESEDDITEGLHALCQALLNCSYTF